MTHAAWVTTIRTAAVTWATFEGLHDDFQAGNLTESEWDSLCQLANATLSWRKGTGNPHANIDD